MEITAQYAAVYGVRQTHAGSPGAKDDAASVKRGGTPAADSERLSDPLSDESRELEKLKQRDREVRQHEQAHLAVAGQYAHSGAQFTYTRGPDGRNYATGGEVQIDTSPVPGDPQATIQKMQTVRRAAMAPAEPSPQDRAVAAEASAALVQAQAELRQAGDADETGGGSSEPVETGRRRANAEYRIGAPIQDRTGASLIDQYA